MPDFGARLRALRTQDNASLQQVADAVGVSKAHLWDLETGRSRNPSMGLLTSLARHFRVRIAFLVGEEARDADMDRTTHNSMRLTAKPTPYSSAVGGGLTLLNEDGSPAFMLLVTGTTRGITKAQSEAISRQVRDMIDASGGIEVPDA